MESSVCFTMLLHPKGLHGPKNDLKQIFEKAKQNWNKTQERHVPLSPPHLSSPEVNPLLSCPRSFDTKLGAPVPLSGHSQV